MTVSASSTYEFNVADIVKMAYQTAGLISAYQTLNTQQSQLGMDLLDLITKSTQTMGLFAKIGTFYNLPLLAGTTSYTLPGTILDLDGDGAFIDAGQSLTAAAGETPVRPISREQYQTQSAKNATGRPIEYFADRTDAAVVVSLWPTPDAGNAGTIRFQTHRLRADTREGQATIDFEPFWQEYFVCELAARLALAHSMNLSRVQWLKSESQEKLERCRAQSQQRGSQQFVVSHRSGCCR
jgi:hypothetical protein